MSLSDETLIINPDNPTESTETSTGDSLKTTVHPQLCQPIIDINNSHQPINETIPDTKSLDPTSYHLFTHINNHPQSPDTPVIISINWDDLPTISDPDTASNFAKELFKHSNNWKNKKTIWGT